jgi:hypothetical protein
LEFSRGDKALFVLEIDSLMMGDVDKNASMFSSPELKARELF